MRSFIEEFSDETKIIISNTVGIISALIFIYISFKSNYYSSIYLKFDKNIINFMQEIGMTKFFFITMAILVSVFLACYSIYLNVFNIINTTKNFNRITTLIGILLTIACIVFGVYNSRNIIKLFVMMTLVSIIIVGIGASIFSTDNSRS